jgi:hypothetical protein
VAVRTQLSLHQLVRAMRLGENVAWEAMPGIVPIVDITQLLQAHQAFTRPLESHTSVQASSHATETTRATITVPEGSFALLIAAQVHIRRLVAASLAVGYAEAKIRIMRGGSSQRSVIRASIFNNAVGALDNAAFQGQGIPLYAGDTVQFRTVDESTAAATGSVDYTCSMICVEYPQVQ